MRERRGLVNASLVSGERSLRTHLGDVPHEQRRERLVERGALFRVVGNGRPPRHQFNARRGDGSSLRGHLVSLTEALNQSVGDGGEPMLGDDGARVRVEPNGGGRGGFR